ncbi:NAD-dependent epimerase/dehydratase family protein [Rubrimonas cliftonensis]|uniref:UDP-glucose 4-epimerase n=1 Tax=Rubrimonas cliftonensis TaxID=89524 RepID=A0A1H3XMN9_9RHOB|nr:NAD(P)-dependent oxidoreductase [Rubrimonas cliftonensis]SDZ99842.1 UDP-glucose 4-epimerase [Rubrimonas cliftonensis]
MRVLITGGSGFLGLALTEALLEAGAEVETLSLDPVPGWAAATAPAGVRRQTGDVRDREALDAILRAGRFDAVIHAAAATPDAARERAGGAAAFVALNVGAAADVVEAAAAAGTPRVVAMSSVAAYGRTADETDRLDEAGTVCAPQSLYGATKLAAEAVALRVGAALGVEVVAPRLGPMWGPWEWRTPVRPTPSPPYQMVGLARRGAAVALARPARAPLIYSRDAARAIVRLLAAPGAAGAAVNVGAAQTTDLADFAAAVARRWPACEGGGAGDVALLGADRPPMNLDRLERLIGPAPATPMEAALDDWAQWLGQFGPGDGPFG